MEGFSQVYLLVWIVVLTGAVFGVGRVQAFGFLYIYMFIYV